MKEKTSPAMAGETDTNTVVREDRISLSNEWHARPNISLPPPMRCTHILSLREAGTE